jgi:hypothetical protein
MDCRSSVKERTRSFDHTLTAQILQTNEWMEIRVYANRSRTRPHLQTLSADSILAGKQRTLYSYKNICLRTTYVYVGVVKVLDSSLFLPTVPRVRHVDVAEEASVRTHARSRGICSDQSGIGIGFSPITSVFPCHYHPTIAPYAFSHLPPTLHNPSDLWRRRR